MAVPFYLEQIYFEGFFHAEYHFAMRKECAKERRLSVQNYSKMWPKISEKNSISV